VHQAVDNVWSALFTAAVEGTTILAQSLLQIVLIAKAIEGRRLLFLLLLLFVVLCFSVLGALVIRARYAGIAAMTQLEQNWRIKWVWVAIRALTDLHQNPASARDAGEEIGQASFIYRKRAFHLYFLHLVAAMGLQGVHSLAFGCVVIFGALKLADPATTQFHVGDVITLISSTSFIFKSLQEMGTILYKLPTGHHALLQIRRAFIASQHLAGCSVSNKEEADYRHPAAAIDGAGQNHVSL